MQAVFVHDAPVVGDGERHGVVEPLGDWRAMSATTG
jgi:hypothetical protein